LNLCDVTHWSLDPAYLSISLQLSQKSSFLANISHDKMKSHSHWLARKAYSNGTKTGLLIVATILAGLSLRNDNQINLYAIFAGVVLVGGWFGGPSRGCLLGAFIALLVMGVTHWFIKEPLVWWDAIYRLLFFSLAGSAAGWLGSHQRRLWKAVKLARRKSFADMHSRLNALEKTNEVLLLDINKLKQTEIALRRSEAYLAEAQRLSHTGSWAYDVATGVPVYWSLERCRISKFDPAKGHPTLEEYRQLHTSDDWEKLMEAFQCAIREKTDFETDSREVLADGTVKYLHIVGHPVLNAAGNVVELLGSTMDMTERKRTDEILQKAHAHLNHITHMTMMGELAASIAHEVNQPLGAVITNAEACLRWLDQQSPDLNEAREAARRIVRDGRRGGDVITRIRALLKKESPVSVLLNLNDVIQETIALTQARLRGITLRIELEQSLPLVCADRVHLQQVLLNLMTNAADAMNLVTERLRVLHIQTFSQTPKMILVRIQDSGPGLDPHNMEQLFEPFYTTKAQGLGMGLSISRSIIEAHGGRLWAESAGASGAIFQFTLPVEDQL
jgi:C4-dicarboxylate-specific signal transduction histidine kinase